MFRTHCFTFGWASMGLVAAIAVGYFSPMRLLPSRTDQNVWTLLFLVTILGAFVLGAARRHSDIVYEGKLSRERERLDAQTVARIDRARTGERERIAREVHDIVAHNLAVIQVQASTSIAVGSEEQLGESMLTIKRTSSEALTEIRALVRLLRDQETGAVAGDLSQVRTFVQAARAAGIRVDADLPDDDTLAEWQARWPNLVRATLLRVTQEAVTNVIKHGGPDAQGVAVPHRRSTSPSAASSASRSAMTAWTSPSADRSKRSARRSASCAAVASPCASASRIWGMGSDSRCVCPDARS